MTAMFGMMAMVPVMFATAGYVLVSSRGSSECTNPPRLRPDRDAANILDLSDSVDALDVQSELAFVARPRVHDPDLVDRNHLPAAIFHEPDGDL